MSSGAAGMLADASTLVDLPLVLIALPIVFAAMAVVAGLAYLLVYYVALPTGVRLAHNAGVADYVIEYTGGPDVVYHVELKNRRQALNAAVVAAARAFWGAVVSAAVRFVTTLIEVASSLWERLPLLLGLFLLATAAFVWRESHPTIIKGYLAARQGTIWPIFESTIYPILNGARLIFNGIFVAINNAVWRVVDFIIFGALRLLLPCVSIQTALDIIIDVAEATKLLALAIADFAAAGLFTARIELTPPLQAFGAIPQARLLPILDCECTALDVIWAPLTNFTNLPSLHATIDCGVNALIRGFQAPVAFLLDFLGGNTLALPDLEPLVEELECFTFALGDLVEDAIDDLLGLAIAALDLVGAAVSVDLTALHAASQSGSNVSSSSVSTAAATASMAKLVVEATKSGTLRASSSSYGRYTLGHLLLLATPVRNTGGNGTVVLTATRPAPRLGEIQWTLRHHTASRAELKTRMSSLFDFDTGLPALDTLLRNVLGFEGLVRLADAPWSHAVTGVVVAVERTFNMTLTLAFHIGDIDAGGPGVAYAYLQLRPIFDAIRIAADGVSQLGIIFDPTLPCQLRELLDVVIGIAESVVEIVLTWIIALIYPSWTIGTAAPCLSAPNPATACKVVPVDWSPVDFLADYFGQADNAVLRFLQHADASLDCGAVVLGCNSSNLAALQNGTSTTVIDCEDALLTCLARTIGRFLVTLVRTALTIIFYLPDLARFNYPAYRSFADISLTPITDDLGAVFECLRRFLVYFGDPTASIPAEACLTPDGLGRLPANVNATRPHDTPARFLPARLTYDCGVDGRAYYAGGTVFDIQRPVIVLLEDGVNMEHLACNEARRLQENPQQEAIASLRDSCITTEARTGLTSSFASRVRLVGLPLTWSLRYTGNVTLDTASSVALGVQYVLPLSNDSLSADIDITGVTSGPGANILPPVPTGATNCTSTKLLTEAEGTPLPPGYACFASGKAYYGSVARLDTPAFATLSPIVIGDATGEHAACGDVGIQIPFDTATYSLQNNITCSGNYLYVDTGSGTHPIAFIKSLFNAPFPVPLSCGADGLAATRLFCRFNELFSYQPTEDTMTPAALTFAPARILDSFGVALIPVLCDLRPDSARPPCFQCNGTHLLAATVADKAAFNCTSSTPRDVIRHNATQTMIGSVVDGGCQPQTRFRRPHCANIPVYYSDSASNNRTLRAEFNYLDSAAPAADVVARYYDGNIRLKATCLFSLFQFVSSTGAAVSSSSLSYISSASSVHDVAQSYGLTPGAMQLIAGTNDQALYDQASFEDVLNVASLRARYTSWRGRLMLRAETLREKRDLQAAGLGPIVPEDTLYRYGMDAESLAYYDAMREAPADLASSAFANGSSSDTVRLHIRLAAGDPVFYKQTFLCSLAGTVNATSATATSFLAEILGFLRGLAIFAADVSTPPDLPTFAESVAALHEATCSLAVTITRIFSVDFTCSFSASTGSVPVCDTGGLCSAHFLCDITDALITPLDVISDILASVRFFIRGTGALPPLFGDSCNKDNLDTCFVSFVAYVVKKGSYLVTNAARSLAAFLDCLICYVLSGGSSNTSCTPIVYSIVDPLATLVEGLLNEVLILLVKLVLSVITFGLQLISGSITEAFDELGNFFLLLGQLLKKLGGIVLKFFLSLPVIGDILRVVVYIIVSICDTLEGAINLFAEPDIDLGCGNIVIEKKRVAPGEGWLPALPAATRAAWANPGTAQQCRQRVAMWNDTRGGAGDMLPTERREFVYCVSLAAWLPVSRGGRLPDGIVATTLLAGCDHLMSSLLFGSTSATEATSPVNERPWTDLGAVEQERVLDCVRARAPMEYARLRHPEYATALRHDFFYNMPYSLVIAMEDAIHGYAIYGQYAADRSQPGQVLLSSAYRESWAPRGYPATHLAALQSNVALAIATTPPPPPPPPANASGDPFAAAADRYYALPAVRAAAEAERRMLEDSDPDGLTLPKYAERFMQQADLSEHWRPITGRVVQANPAAAERAALGFAHIWRYVFTGKSASSTSSSPDSLRRQVALDDDPLTDGLSPIARATRDLTERFRNHRPVSPPRLNMAAMMGGARSVGGSDTDAAAARRARVRAVNGGSEVLLEDLPAVVAKLVLFAYDRGSGAIESVPGALANVTRALYFGGVAAIHTLSDALGAGAAARQVSAQVTNVLYPGHAATSAALDARSIWARPSEIFPGANDGQSMLGAALSSAWAMRAADAASRQPSVRGVTIDTTAALWAAAAEQPATARSRAANFLRDLSAATRESIAHHRVPTPRQLPTTTTATALTAAAPHVDATAIVCLANDTSVVNGSCETCYLTLCQQCIYADRGVAAVLGALLQISFYYQANASAGEATFAYTQQETASLAAYLQDRSTPIRLGDADTTVLPLVWPSPQHSYLRLFGDRSPNKQGIADFIALGNRALDLLTEAPSDIFDAISLFFGLGDSDLVNNATTTAAASAITAETTRACHVNESVSVCAAEAIVANVWRSIGSAALSQSRFRRSSGSPASTKRYGVTTGISPSSSSSSSGQKRALGPRAAASNESISDVAIDAVLLLYETLIRCRYTDELDGSLKRFSLAETTFFLVVGILALNAIVVLARIPVSTALLNVSLVAVFIPVGLLVTYDRSLGCMFAVPLQLANDLVDVFVNTILPRCSPYLPAFLLNSNEYTPDTCHVPEAYTGGNAATGVPDFQVGHCVYDAGLLDFGYDLAFLLEVAFPDVQAALRKAGAAFPLLGALFQLPALDERIMYWRNLVASLGGDLGNDIYLYARLYSCFFGVTTWTNAAIFAFVAALSVIMALPLARNVWSLVGSALAMGAELFFVAIAGIHALCAGADLVYEAKNPRGLTVEDYTAHRRQRRGRYQRVPTRDDTRAVKLDEL